jgi:adenylate cyclase
LDLKKYISELKRRNVIKAGLAYLIIAWLVIQVASVVLPTFNVPSYFMKTLLFGFAIGFPIWLVFAWVYEMTPDGIKKTKEVKEDDSILSKTGAKFNKLIIAVLSLAIVYLLFNQFGNRSVNSIELQDKNEAIELVKDKNDTINFIAVLPFHNSKPNLETDYLGFALADQIIGDLRYFKNIVVRPSSSVRKYEKKVVDSKTVGEELHVSYVLNGNYLIENDSIRLNIELIDVNTDEMIWREPIQVGYQNAFELQDIVAKKVVNGMNIQFSENEINSIGKNIPNHPLAYEYYLKSLSYSDSEKDHKLAIEMLKNSIKLDSNYAPAYNELGNRIKKLVSYGGENPANLKKAEELFLKAISLDNGLLKAYSNLSALYAEQGKLDEAIEVSKKMLKINPNNATAHFSLGYIYRYAGMQIESIMEMEKATRINPNDNFAGNLSLSYSNIGDYEKAIKSLEIIEESIFAMGMKAFIYLKQGKKNLAIKYANQILNEDSNQFWKILANFYLAYFDGNKEECLRLLKIREESNTTDGEPIYYDAEDYALIKNKEGSIRNLQKAVDHGYFNYPLMKNNSLFDFIRNDPGFKKVLKQAKQKHEAFKKKHFE